MTTTTKAPRIPPCASCGQSYRQMIQRRGKIWCERCIAEGKDREG